MKKNSMMNESYQKKRTLKRVFWGLFFILGAAAVVLNQMGMLAFGLSWFNTVLLVFLVAILIKSLVNLNWAGIFFPLAIAGIIFAQPLGIENLVPWPILLVALLLSIGFSIIFQRRRRERCFERHHQDENFDQVINSKDGSVVDVDVSFGSIIKYINSEALKQANLHCAFGALKVYFDGAKLDKDGAVINLDLSFGAVEMYLPKEWRVINKTNSSFAGMDEKNPQMKLNQEKKTVIIAGDLSFAGVEIIYV